MSWFSGARTRMQLLFGRRAAESRINEEVRFHLEMETARLIRDEGVIPAEARRRARAAFGGVTQYTETLKDGRGLAWLSGLSLDLKLGFRMLVKYPGLTLIGGMSIAFGIWFGAVTFQMVGVLTSPALPLPGGDRIQNDSLRRIASADQFDHDVDIRIGQDTIDLGRQDPWGQCHPAVFRHVHIRYPKQFDRHTNAAADERGIAEEDLGHTGAHRAEPDNSDSNA